VQIPVQCRPARDDLGEDNQVAGAFDVGDVVVRRCGSAQEALVELPDVEQALGFPDGAVGLGGESAGEQFEYFRLVLQGALAGWRRCGLRSAAVRFAGAGAVRTVRIVGPGERWSPSPCGRSQRRVPSVPTDASTGGRPAPDTAARSITPPNPATNATSRPGPLSIVPPFSPAPGEAAHPAGKLELPDRVRAATRSPVPLARVTRLDERANDE
jgi:hypothetical protein